MKRLEFPAVIEASDGEVGFMVEIQVDDPLSVCTIYHQNGHITSYGYARKKPEDVFNWYKGAEMAFKSALFRKDKNHELVSKDAREQFWMAFWVATAGNRVVSYAPLCLTPFLKELVQRWVEMDGNGYVYYVRE